MYPTLVKLIPKATIKSVKWNTVYRDFRLIWTPTHFTEIKGIWLNCKVCCTTKYRVSRKSVDNNAGNDVSSLCVNSELIVEHTYKYKFRIYYVPNLLAV